MAISDVIQLYNSLRPSVGPIVLDGALQEEHAIEAEQTENPIEEGGVVSDHRIVRPRQVTIVGVILSFPVTLLGASPTRHVTVWRRLRDMVLRGDLHDVVTGLEIYPSMALTSVRTTRGAGGTSANSLDVTLTLQRIEFARLSVDQQLADQIQDLALAQAELGAQGAVATP